MGDKLPVRGYKEEGEVRIETERDGAWESLEPVDASEDVDGPRGTSIEAPVDQNGHTTVDEGFE